VCAAIDAALQSAISCAEFGKWLERVMDLDAGKRDLADRVELHFEATPELAAIPRLSRTIRRQTASRRRLRRAREPLQLDEVEEVIEDLELEPEPVEDAEEIREAIEIVRKAAPALKRIEPVRIMPPLEPVRLEPPVVLIAPKAPAPTSSSRRTTKRISRVPSRLLLAAAFVGALAVTAHRTRLHAALPMPEPEDPPPTIEEPLDGTACVELDPHCAVEPKPAPVIAPPARKLPETFGWVHVHSNGTVGQVFVAARAWGEPEKTIAVPCGRMFVNVARADSKGNWRGWTNIGEIVNIACDGTVTELTLKAMNASYEVKTPKPKLATLVSALRSSTWPMSKP
jgi:hypothetical protein